MQSSGGEIRRWNACFFLYFCCFWPPNFAEILPLWPIIANQSLANNENQLLDFCSQGHKRVFFSTLHRQNGRSTLLERKLWFPVKIKKNSRFSSYSSIIEINQVTDVSHSRRTNVWMLECELWQDNEWFRRVCKIVKHRNIKNGMADKEQEGEEEKTKEKDIDLSLFHSFVFSCLPPASQTKFRR